jgi:hypothetical protein
MSDEEDDKPDTITCQLDDNKMEIDLMSDPWSNKRVLKLFFPTENEHPRDAVARCILMEAITEYYHPTRCFLCTLCLYVVTYINNEALFITGTMSCLFLFPHMIFQVNPSHSFCVAFFSTPLFLQQHISFGKAH